MSQGDPYPVRMGSVQKKGYLYEVKIPCLVGGRGKKKALIAVGHKILTACYHILRQKVPYKELGLAYLDTRKQNRIVKSYVKRLQNLGYTVIVEKAA